MNPDRRTFLKLVGVASATSLAGSRAEAASARVASGAMGVLVDTTLCVGCRGCEAACSEANALPAPERPDDERVFDVRRVTAPQVFTVVNRADRLSASGALRFAKTQCLHCVDPACASACPVRALEKQPSGAVDYHRERCIGCRYCMVACPFGVPKYEYAKAVPYVRKCTFCQARQAAGKAPACTEVCPSGALLFGEREALLEEARTRIYQKNGRYVRHIYGEHEAGGTSWFYITDIPFENLGLRAGVGTTPYPELTRTALSAVPFVMTLWPPLLMGLYAFSKRRNEEARGAEEDEHA
jgi:Fe-S-cluster-containing dehydrogenase component